jgi:uncharacterized damage-inducible protein DinB
MTKNRLGWSVVVAALTLLTAGPALAQATGGSAPAAGAAATAFPATSFLTPAKATWESTRALVLGIAEIFPEDKYDFKPTPAVRSLRENLIHLIGENYFFFSKVSGETLPDNARFNALKSRDEILKELRASYDYDAKVWGSLTEEKAQELVEGRNNQKVQRWSFILGAIQDNMNHYGNLVVYARLNGLVPPRSAGR